MFERSNMYNNWHWIKLYLYVSTSLLWNQLSNMFVLIIFFLVINKLILFKLFLKSMLVLIIHVLTVVLAYQSINKVLAIHVLVQVDTQASTVKHVRTQFNHTFINIIFLIINRFKLTHVIIIHA